MAMFRRAADKYIDQAHCAIGCAEIQVEYAYTDESKAAALDQLCKAQRFLARACAAKRAWDAVEHDEYEEYPVVTEEEQEVLI